MVRVRSVNGLLTWMVRTGGPVVHMICPVRLINAEFLQQLYLDGGSINTPLVSRLKVWRAQEVYTSVETHLQ
jgi:hypothetical protein